MTWAFSDPEANNTLQELVLRRAIVRDYLIIDVETLGFGKTIPIVQIGWGVVNDAQLLNVESLLLNWSDPKYGLSQSWIQDQMARVTADMASKNKRYCTTYERMCAEGVDPCDGLEVLMDLIESYLRNEQRIVGHNAWMFDCRKIDFHCEQFFDYKPTWPPNSVFDTGLVEKAMQTNRPPWTGESFEEWYRRIYGGPSKVKWSLEEHCAEKYEFAARYGVDVSLAHDAGHDCRLTYCLFETYREIAENCFG